MVHTPAHPFLTPDGWLRYHDDLAAATGLPLLPYVRTSAVGTDAIVELARRPFTAAVKFALPDLITFATVQSAAPDATAWICGIAELWAPAFAAHGAVGFTSGLANVLPAVSLGLHRDLAAGDGCSEGDVGAHPPPRAAAGAGRGRSQRGRDQGGVAPGRADFGPVRPPSGDLAGRSAPRWWPRCACSRRHPPLDRGPLDSAAEPSRRHPGGHPCRILSAASRRSC